MTEVERLNLIKSLVKKAKKKAKRASKEIQSDFVPLEPTAPTEFDIHEELDNLTRYTANQYINNED
jgi:hypothetical protein|tara:strand:+ start:1079 stop:1276 length:198 start_codon:yes stop_codon:yes gene_type:complete